jgi:hypothetical protein
MGLGAMIKKGKGNLLQKTALAAYNFHPHIRLLVTEGGEEECLRIPRRGWAEMIRKVYEVDQMLCPECGDTMKGIAFPCDFSIVDRIINHLKLSFMAAKPPSPRIAYQEVLMAVETSAEYFS